MEVGVDVSLLLDVCCKDPPVFLDPDSLTGLQVMSNKSSRMSSNGRPSRVRRCLSDVERIRFSLLWDRELNKRPCLEGEGCSGSINLVAVGSRNGWVVTAHLLREVAVPPEKSGKILGRFFQVNSLGDDSTRAVSDNDSHVQTADKDGEDTCPELPRPLSASISRNLSLSLPRHHGCVVKRWPFLGRGICVEILEMVVCLLLFKFYPQIHLREVGSGLRG
jgi:hypothetical protein